MKDKKSLSDAGKEVGLEISGEESNICSCLITGMQVKIMT
jgi:hypothetical protein